MAQQTELQAVDVFKAARERLARQQEEKWQAKLQEILALIDLESSKVASPGHVSVKMPSGPGTNLIAHELADAGFKVATQNFDDKPTAWFISWS